MGRYLDPEIHVSDWQRLGRPVDSGLDEDGNYHGFDAYGEYHPSEIFMQKAILQG